MADAGGSPTDEFKVGARVKVSEAAGPRLAGKHGIILARARYYNAVRVKLDDSKFPVTLHRTLLSLEAEP